MRENHDTDNPVVWGGLQEHQHPRNDGISPALTAAMGMGGGMTQVLTEKEPIVDVYNKRILKGDACGTITAHGNASYTTCGTFGVIEEGERKVQNEIADKVNIVNPDGTVRDDPIDLNNIVSASQGNTRYRIRKLTPLECWRLMDFSDEDFKKAEEVNSNTQLYKQAGNSIVCNVLVAIMGQMFSGKETVYQERAEQIFFNQSV